MTTSSAIVFHGRPTIEGPTVVAFVADGAGALEAAQAGATSRTRSTTPLRGHRR